MLSGSTKQNKEPRVYSGGSTPGLIRQHSQLNQHHASRSVGLSAILTSNLRLIIILCVVSVPNTPSAAPDGRLFAVNTDCPLLLPPAKSKQSVGELFLFFFLFYPKRKFCAISTPNSHSGNQFPAYQPHCSSQYSKRRRSFVF